MSGAFRPRLGIIGGMGPLASADFYRKLTELTPARSDTDHVPLALFSMPDLPDRSAAILNGSDILLARLLEAVATLNALGVERIAMPCNTAHHWYDRLAGESAAEIVHIVRSAVGDLGEVVAGGSVAVLATPGTLASGFYQRELAGAGHAVRFPAAGGWQDCVDHAIALVKAGKVRAAAKALDAALGRCAEAGIDAAILACTELSVVAPDVAPRGLTVVDSNRALARASLRGLGIESRASGASGAVTRHAPP